MIYLIIYGRKCTFKQTLSVSHVTYLFLSFILLFYFKKRSIVHLPSSSSSPWGSHFFKEPYLQAWVIVRTQAQGSRTIPLDPIEAECGNMWIIVHICACFNSVNLTRPLRRGSYSKDLVPSHWLYVVKIFMYFYNST